MKLSYDATGMETEEEFPLAPEGEYTLAIKEVYDTDKEGNPKFTQNGDPMVSVRCEIDDAKSPYFGISVWNNVTFMKDKEKKGAGMALHFLKAIGEPYEGEFEVDTDNWIAKTFLAKITIGEFKGRRKNEIKYVIIPEPSEGDGDEVPF